MILGLIVCFHRSLCPLLMGCATTHRANYEQFLDEWLYNLYRVDLARVQQTPARIPSLILRPISLSAFIQAFDRLQGGILMVHDEIAYVSWSTRIEEVD